MMIREKKKRNEMSNYSYETETSPLWWRVRQFSDELQAVLSHAELHVVSVSAHSNGGNPEQYTIPKCSNDTQCDVARL